MKGLQNCVMIIGAWLSLASTGLAKASHHLNPAWVRLLHYESSISGGWVGAGLHPQFYLDKRGRNDPKAELAKTIELMVEAPQTYQCSFPARAAFIRHHITPLPETSCPEYEAWRRAFVVAEVSLVFSAPYANHAASLFGHIFLRLDRPRTHGAGFSHLVDYGVNFGANIDPSHHFLEYAFHGLFGGYHGRYAISPYYVMVNKYANHESRDLWEYAIKLLPGEVDRLVAHLWELIHVGVFQYYFLDGNCASYIVKLMEIAKPTVKLSQGLGVYHPPTGVVQAMARAGLLENPRYRPSLHSQFERRYQALNAPEKRAFQTSQASRSIEAVDHNENSLYAYASWLNYQKHKDDEANRPQGHNQDLLRRSLARLSRLKTPRLHQLSMTSSDRPEQGHSQAAMGIGWLKTRASQGSTLQVRLGHHSFLDSSQGYKNAMETELLKASLLFPEDQEADPTLATLVLLNLTSLRPYNHGQGLSWNASLTYQNPRLDPDAGSTVRGGFGVALKYISKVYVFGFLKARGSMLQESEATQRLWGPEASFGALWDSQPFRLKLTHSMFQPTGDTSLHRASELGVARSLGHQWQLEGQWYARRIESIPAYQGGSLTISKFF